MISSSKKEYRKFDPSLIWTEISSYIKGSYETLQTKTGYLSEEQYQNVGKKKAPNFSHCRGDIYQLFKSYEQIKERDLMYDRSDVIQHVCHQIMTYGYKGTPLHLAIGMYLNENTYMKVVYL